MANGYCTPLLMHIEALATCNPAKKLSPLGFLQMLLNCADGSAELNNRYEDGHQRDLTVKYRKRPLESAISDTASGCDVGDYQVYNEFSLPSLLYREAHIFVPDSLIRQYCKDSSAYVKLDSNGNSVMSKQTYAMKEVYDLLIEYGGTLLRSMNTALVGQAATKFGKNVVTGDAAAREISFNLGSVGMQDAFIQLIADWRENELCDDVCMVGSGDFANFDLIKRLYSGTDDTGLNRAALGAAMPKVWFDKAARSIWGANQIGVFEKGSAALLTRNMYEGSFARALGTSNLFTMALPVDEYCCPQEGLEKLTFDVQIKEIDCPTTMTLNGVANQTVGQGVLIILSKNFSLFTKPANLFEDSDELYGTNGILRYEITGKQCGCPDSGSDETGSGSGSGS